MGFLGRLNADYAKRYTPTVRPRKPDQTPPGGFSFGTGIYGGPEYTDAYNSRHGPSPWRLVDKYRALIYAMVARNRDGVTRIPLRLYMDGSRAQGGKPNRVYEPIQVSRSMGQRFARAGLISSAAVDQVYEIRTHPLLDALDKPDPYGYFTRKQFLGLICSYCDVVGQAFIVPDGNGWDWRADSSGRKKGPPDYLWVIYSQYVYPIRSAGSPMVDYWQYFRDRLPFDATLRFRQSISLRDPYGSSYSPTYAGDMYADQEERYTANWDQVLGIGARPNLIVSAKDPMFPPGDTERQRFQTDLNRKQAGGEAGGIVVTNGAWDFMPVDYPKADIAAKEINEYDRNCLAAIFGQPPTYYVTDTNVANLTAADEQFARTSVEPRCDAISGVLTNFARIWDPRLFFKHDPAIQEDDESREKVISMRLASGRTTINQENQEDKYPPVDWGDEPWLPQTLVQPSMAREKHEQALKQGQAAMESQQKQDDFELRDEDANGQRALMQRALRLTEAIERRLAS